jgi:hypothetical protein
VHSASKSAGVKPCRGYFGGEVKHPDDLEAQGASSGFVVTADVISEKKLNGCLVFSGCISETFFFFFFFFF